MQKNIPRKFDGFESLWPLQLCICNYFIDRSSTVVRKFFSIVLVNDA